jgi:hypothetical protein
MDNKSSFSLYDLLYKKCMSGPQDITIEEVKELVENVKKLDKEGYELLFVLIKTYSNLEDKKEEIPYEGQKINEGVSQDRICDVKFDIRKFSPMLRKILLEFSRLHTNKMIDESKRIQ